MASFFNELAQEVKSNPFVYKSMGQIAYVGHGEAVGEVGHWKMTGFASWWVSSTHVHPSAYCTIYGEH